jgi:hypothetical protein
LAHTVSIDDKKARDNLAAGITVPNTGLYSMVNQKMGLPRRISLIAIECGVLALFSIVFLGLTMWDMKRKKVL